MFVTFWSAITLVFDGFIGYGMYNQSRAMNFESTTGTVLSSEVETHSDSDGTTYKPVIEYKYEVAGQSYQADRIRFSMMSSGGSYANEMVAKYAKGKQIEVFFNPQVPGESVLIRGVQGSDLFLLFFMTPFNLIMVTGWLMGISCFWPKRETKLSIPVVDDGRRIRLKLNRGSPLVAAGIFLGAATFFLIFVIGFGFGFDPPVGVMVGVWIVVLVGAAAVFVWMWTYNLSGKSDLVIDRFRETLELPRTDRKQSASRLVSLREIDKAVAKKETPASSGAENVNYYEVLLEPTRETDKSICVAKGLAQEKALELTDWLNQQWLNQS